jgi:hypothetical protein
MPSGSNSTEGSKSVESEVKETGEETDEAKVTICISLVDPDPDVVDPDPDIVDPDPDVVDPDPDVVDPDLDVVDPDPDVVDPDPDVVDPDPDVGDQIRAWFKILGYKNPTFLL